MKTRGSIRGVLLSVNLGAALLLVAYSPSTPGFAEDVCPNAAGGWGNCPIQPCPQDLAESGNLLCETIAMATTIVSQQLTNVVGPGRRSTLHMDATYYMAQAAGFTPRQAYQIAAYDQIPDWPDYELLDEYGNLLVSRDDCESEDSSGDAICELVPKAITGFDRNNFAGAGLNYHFMAPQLAYGAPPLPMDGLHPDFSDPYSEHFLAHVRRWAFGDSEQLCAGGITTRSARGDYATGDACYRGERESPAYLGQIPFITEISPLTNANWLTPLGEQLVSIDPPVPASALAGFVGADVAPLARLGIYAHAVADRVSHHLCVTASYLEGPRPVDAGSIVTLPLGYAVFLALTSLTDPQYLLEQLLVAPVVSNPDFLLKFSDEQCDQLAHAMRHTFEAGHEQDSLHEEHQTLRPGLAAVYDELVAYAQRHGFARTQSSEFRAQMLDGLTAAITTPAAQARIDALTAFAEAMGLVPLPGYGGLDYAAWSAKAGALEMTPADGSSGGGALSMRALAALLGLALLAAVLRQRRARHLGAAVLLAGTPASALAFAEDLCPSTTGGWTNCPLQLCTQDLAESGTLVCEALAMGTNVVGQQLGGAGRRSGLHMDATYYLAQAVGFTPRQAFQIAIYDQSADLGQVDFHDQTGAPLVTQDDCADPAAAPEACLLLAKPVTGFDRNNFAGGGLNYHFMGPQVAYGAPPLPMDGMAPDLRDPYSEHFLAHVRRWAFGESPLLCVGGLTTRSARGDYATGDACYSGKRASPSYLGHMPVADESGPLTPVFWVSPTGEQLINISEPTVAAHELADYVGRDVAPLVALGIYLHAVADRVSHQLCVKTSYLEGPRPLDAPPIVTQPISYDVWLLLQYRSDPDYMLQQMLTSPVVSNPDFYLKFHDAECDQPSHANRHTFETGYAQQTLHGDHQTLEPALRHVYDELAAYARQHGFADAHSGDAVYREQLLAELIALFEDADAQARVDGMTQLAVARGWLPLPGFGGLDYPAWSAKAGTLAIAPAEGGGGALGLQLLLATLALAALRRAPSRFRRSPSRP
ncbi:MAG: hypothetical protein VYC42_15425 [Pseudomonadota bacterium]|nr:hypothetical protein [Pseudomonadota bacterium]